MNKVLISIIVPVYNVEKHLKTCIESIIDQTYNNIEIILVNDGSTDSSLRICKKYKEKDNRIVLINKSNEGLSSTRQAGIDKAKGEYFCTVDSDDYIENNFIEKMYRKINKDKSDICVCGTRHYKRNVSEVRGFNSNLNLTINISLDKLKKDFNNLLGTYFMSDSWNKIYRMDFVKNSGVTFTLNKEFNGTDLLFNHLLMLHLPRITVLNEPLYNHQILENSRVRRKNKQLQKGFFIIFDKILQEISSLGYSELLNDQLSYLYLDLQRNAAQDVFDSETNMKDKRYKIKKFLLENKYYLSNDKMKITIKETSTFSMKLFYLCLKSNKSFKMLSYLALRKFLIKYQSKNKVI